MTHALGTRAPLALLLLLLLSASRSSSAAVTPGKSEAAVRAATEKRFCDAAHIFLDVHGESRDALPLYRAAETAWAADDRQMALRLYRTLLDNHPDFDKRESVEKKVADLLALIAESGAGAPCAQPPRVCGDWIVAVGEGCDDGNLKDGDGCDATCVPTGCGNGIVTAGEACDDGNTNDGDGCEKNCTQGACGNGVTAAGEVCDDGNAIDGDGCDSNCTATGCGNGIVTAFELCDDANTVDGDGCDGRCGQAPVGRAPAGASSSSPSSSPWPLALYATGGATMVAGAVAAGIGAWPAVLHALARNDITAAEGRIDDDAQGALQDAREAQTRQAQATADFQSWGLPLALGGGALAVVGVGVAVAGFVLSGLEEPARESPAGSAGAVP